MRPLDQQTILITGATDGLGRALAGELAAAGTTLLLHGRDDAKGQATIDEMRARTGNEDLHWLRADLASLDEGRGLAEQVARGRERLDVLVNNAGIGTSEGGGGRMESRDGHELRFAVNYLAGYLLTRLLLPLLERSAPARIVNVASIGQQPLDFADLMLEHAYSGVVAYRRSKLAQITFTFDLAGELVDQGVTANAVHPATLMDTPMVRDAGIQPMSTVDEGAAATLRLIAAPELDGVTGRFFNGLHEARANEQAYDIAARARLHEISEQLVRQALA
jgi:NAD(P)-dependent dehydrogenase (short-subunit alcohol dehydrogenase family)